MPRADPADFRVRAVSLIRAGQTVERSASDLDVSCVIFHRWVKQGKMYRGEIPDVLLAEFRDMCRSRKRIRELEGVVENFRRAQIMLGSSSHHLDGFTRYLLSRSRMVIG